MTMTALSKASGLESAFWPPAGAESGLGGGYGPGNARWRAAHSGRYPLTAAACERSFQPAAAGACEWPRVWAALEAGAPVRVLVLGGSMTYGVACAANETLSNQPCAWPSEVDYWLHAAFSRWNLTLVNGAHGGVAAGAFARDPSLPTADVYIVDTVVNDLNEADRDSALSGYEMLLWRLLHARGLGGRRPALLQLATFTTGRGLGDWAWADTVTNYTRHYGLPQASYRDAVWPVFGSPEDDLLSFWWSPLEAFNFNHPAKRTHEMVADIVKYALLAQREHSMQVVASGSCNTAEAEDPPLRPFAGVEASCEASPSGPLASYAANWPTPAFAPTSSTPSWQLYEDVPRKPGWITLGEPGTLTFTLPFSHAHPLLEITYLVSYTGGGSCAGWDASPPGMGAVRVVVELGRNCSLTAVIDGRAPETCHSVPHVAVIGSSAAAAAVTRWRRTQSALHLGDFPISGECAGSIAEGEVYAVRFEMGSSIPGARSGKWKLLAVSSC